MPPKRQSNGQKKQKRSYSGKKKRHTLKAQVVVDRNNPQILCVHVTPRGRCHDRALLRQSKLRLKTQTQALLDSGFQGFQKEHPNTSLPAKNTKRRPLTHQQKNDNRTLARNRVLIEHTIGLLKRFRILAERYRNRRRRFGLRLNLIAAIVNLEWSL